MLVSPEIDLFIQRQTEILIRSFQHWIGRDLLEKKEGDLAQALFEAPFVVVSHGTQVDPILNYGNRKALELWEMDWKTLTSTSSRLTAEPDSREARARLLNEVTGRGYIDHYSGVRISKTGKRFKIENAVVWNLLDEKGMSCGQAAMFKDWMYL